MVNDHFINPRSDKEIDGVKFGWDVSTTPKEKYLNEKKWHKQSREIKKQADESNN